MKLRSKAKMLIVSTFLTITIGTGIVLAHESVDSKTMSLQTSVNTKIDKTSNLMHREINLYNEIDKANEVEEITKTSDTKSILVAKKSSKVVDDEVVDNEPIILLSKDEVVKRTMIGLYGNGNERQGNIENEGYDFNEVQGIVDNLLASNTKPIKLPLTGDSKPKQDESEVVLNDSESSESTLGSKVIPAFPHKTFKSYMRWTALSKKSPQYKLCAKATKDPETAIMMYEDRYLVALGFAYAGDIGEHIDIVMESGQIIPAIVGDWKAKAHTDSNYSASMDNGSIIEFIVSSNKDASAAINGSGNYNSIFPGNVKEFRK